MKKIILIGALLFAFSTINTTNAQVHNNISSQPKWGPVGHDYVEYYYLPEIETYYSVPKHKYMHMNPAGKWVYSNGLPAQYRSYDLYKGHKVVMNEPDAYKYNKDHKVKYANYKGNDSQPVIRDSKEPKYKTASKPARYKAKPKAKGRH